MQRMGHAQTAFGSPAQRKRLASTLYVMFKSRTVSLLVAGLMVAAGLPTSSVAISLYYSTGQLNLSVYNLLSLSYSRSTMEIRLGPSFLDLSPTAWDDRPTLF